MTSHYCNMLWHHGISAEADFLILSAKGEHSNTYPNGFATCEHHAGRALFLMLTEVKTVTAHRVNILSTDAPG